MIEDECTCDEDDELHACPYEMEICANDDAYHCNCCEYCENKCADDI